MASQLALMAAIENKVKGAQEVNYRLWTIGVTEDHSRRKSEHGNPQYWIAWAADSDAIARAVEQHFLDKGMKGGPGGPGTAKYIYIF